MPKYVQGEIWSGLEAAAQQTSELAHDASNLRKTLVQVDQHGKGYCSIVRVPPIQVRNQKVLELVKQALNACLKSCSITAAGWGSEVFEKATKEEEENTDGAIDSHQQM